MTREAARDKFFAIWRKKTTKQVEKELLSWQKYMAKHSQAYDWHGKWGAPPEHLADGDRVLYLREILREKQNTTFGG